MNLGLHNLKTEYNLRGLLTESIVKNYCLSHVFKVKNKEYKKFLNKFPSIDLATERGGNLFLFEIKSITGNSNRKPCLTESSAKAYTEALKRGYNVKVIYVRFLNDWNIKIEEIDFDINNFRINNGGYYYK